MKRVYHDFTKLEEALAGMWRIVNGPERLDYRDRAAELMRDPEAFKNAMRKAITQWPRSCEHNLSAKNMNRLAWTGHAGCCIELESPEECTRLGWHLLNQHEQDEANRVAQEVVDEWEELYTRQLQEERSA